MNILITGDSGFIGSYLTQELIAQGDTIFGIDVNPVKKYDVKYRYTTGDIRDEHVYDQIPQPIDCIVHLAAAHKDFGIPQEEYYAVNVEGMRSLLRFAERTGIHKILFYSSVAVYGDHQPSTEETIPHPVNHYGGSKLEAEKVLQAWAPRDPKREVVILRPTVIFGPLNVANIFKLIKQVCDQRFYWVGDGRNIKSVAYVENVVQATSFLLRRMSPGVHTFNYSDEPHMQTRDLVALISKISGKRVSQFRIPLSLAVLAARMIDIVGRITQYDFSITAARLLKFNTSTEHRSGKIRDAGFMPKYTIEEGLRKNIQWYFENGKRSTINVDTSSE